MKYYKDCKHFIKKYVYSECKRTIRREARISKVTGEVLLDASHGACAQERNSTTKGACGEQAIYFEPSFKFKIKQLWFGWIKKGN